MDSVIQGKLSETLHIFAADAGEVQGSWESQKDEYRQKMLTLAQRVDKALHTLNQTVVRIDAPIVPASFEQTLLPHMIAFMQKWIKDKVKHPKGVAELFPTEELARQIILEFGQKKAEAPIPAPIAPIKLETTEAHLAELAKEPINTKTGRMPTAAQIAFYNRNKKKEPANA